MKNLLLATTFLVAITTNGFAKETLFSAPSKTDFTISGKHEFNYQTWSDDAANTGGANDTKMTNTSTITIKAKTKFRVILSFINMQANIDIKIGYVY